MATSSNNNNNNNEPRDEFMRSAMKVSGKICKKTRRKVESFVLPSTRLIKREFPFLARMSRDTVTEVIKHSGMRPCTRCRRMFSVNRNSDICTNCVSLMEDPTRGLPRSCIIRYCEGCQRYSFSGRAHFFSDITHSDSLLKRLLKKLEYRYYKPPFEITSAKFLQTEPHSKKISIELLLQVEGPNREKVEKSHVVEYYVSDRTCRFCLVKDFTSHCTSVVQVRMHAFDRRRGSLTCLLLVLLRKGAFQVKNCKRVKDGMDFIFAEDSDAKAFLNLIYSLAPISGELNNSTSSSKRICIPVLLCPLYPHDLVYLPPNVSASLGFLGPIAICTKITNSITLLDPLKMMERTLSAKDYWREPFESLKTGVVFEKYIVLDVEFISRGTIYTFADVQIARLSDLGKNDLVFTVRTHLGDILKPGDCALGYPLVGVNINAMGVCSDSLSDVILIRKAREPTTEVKRKNKSPEYEEFLRDLQKNPDAIFNLSLNSGDNVDNQHREVGSDMPGNNSDFDLEGLLADLDLADQEDGDASTKQ